MYIKKIQIQNYRSLKDISVGDLSPVVILYGENNSGKSNLLSFLYHFFRRKKAEEKLVLSDAESSVPQQEEDFWRGEMDNFSDNFYKDTNEPIGFQIHIQFSTAEIRVLGPFPPEFQDKLSANNQQHLVVAGQIGRLGENRASFDLHKVLFNNKSFFKIVKESPVYLDAFEIADPAGGLDTFQRIMGSLNDAFLRIPPDRYISTETELSRDKKVKLNHINFKNWLFQQNLDRESEKFFREIATSFESEPFNHGRISLARIDDGLIEIYVENKGGLKLPLGRKGSGLQQILMILSFVTVTNVPFLGIEELEINLSPKSQKLVFNNLVNLVKSGVSPLKQVFLTTHSPTLGKMVAAERRGVWMVDEETHIKKPTEAEVEDFFSWKNDPK